MSKKSAAKHSQAKAPSAVSARTGVKMRGCDVLVRCLENLGVDTIFAYPGGASMELHQGLTRSK
ncbi:MAG: acetolactate synthase large subunit, partial [Opitutia bacterium]